MLRFNLVENGQSAIDLGSIHLVGTDGVPLRADIQVNSGQILCEKRTAGPAAIAMLWNVPGVGRILVESARVQERERPYNLHRELARGALMRIAQKREDWGLMDEAQIGEIGREIAEARKHFVEAVKADDDKEIAKHADQALAKALTSAEQMSLTYADSMLARRHQIGGFGRRTFGCSIELNQATEAYRNQLVEAFDFARVPAVWREIESKEQAVDWSKIDPWVDWLSKRRIPIRMGPLVSFDERMLPDWLYMWENDFESVRDLIYNHIRRVVGRYGSFVHAWEVISGIHCENSFNFNFEQLMELTRLAAAVCKQVAPKSATIICLKSLWGEYYARNQRTIPPLLYADMAVQSGIHFDAFGLDFTFGAGGGASPVRDMFQISAMIDRLASLGKPFHITAIGVPSAAEASPADAPEPDGGAAGYWKREWDEQTQGEWAREFLRISLSKPYVETVCWSHLSDRPDALPAHSGLLGDGLRRKPAYDVFRLFRKQLTTGAPRMRKKNGANQP